MKLRFIKTSKYSTSFISMTLFIGGMAGALVPVGGRTMPHGLEMAGLEAESCKESGYEKYH